MAIRRTDIDIIIPSATYQQKNDIPVWDAYIEKVVIDGDIPSLISDRLCEGIKSMINGYPQKFSGQLKGNIENLLNETEVSIYKKYGITYSKLRVKRDGYYLLISTKPDKPFEGPAYVVQDMGLGIEEKVISLTREGDRLKTEYTSERAYINDGFEFLIECSDCKAITKVEKYGLSENKPYITRCSQCGKIFINPYYKDPVSESWEKNPPTQIVD